MRGMSAWRGRQMRGVPEPSEGAGMSALGVRVSPACLENSKCWKQVQEGLEGAAVETGGRGVVELGEAPTGWAAAPRKDIPVRAQEEKGDMGAALAWQGMAGKGRNWVTGPLPREGKEARTSIPTVSTKAGLRLGQWSHTAPSLHPPQQLH